MDASFKEISTIIHRDRKFNTYKFALIKATIESITQFEQFLSIDPYRVKLPLGLQILKWLEYYYPFFSSENFIAQQHGDNPKRSLAFRKHYIEVIKFYQEKVGKGFEPIYNSLKTGQVSSEIEAVFLELIRNLHKTIVKNPMNYIGSSINQGGQIYNYNKDAQLANLKSELSINNIIQCGGTYSIPKQYHDVFKLMGSYIIGMDSLMYKWAEFTLNVNSRKINHEQALSLVSSRINESRNVYEIQRFYQRLNKEEKLFCIWSGEKIKNDLNIDHVLPFSFYRNNDIWNLLPSKAQINNKKRDAIPSSNLLTKQKDLIYQYWDIAENNFENVFRNEIEVSLMGTRFQDVKDWKEISFNSLIYKCDFLIHEQGFQPFEL